MSLPRFKMGGDWTSDSPAIVFIHGMGGSLNNFAALFDELATMYPVVTVELPGHGRSEELDETSADKIAERLETVLSDVLDDRQCVIVAHSLGFYFATRIASIPESNVVAIVGISGGLFSVASLVAKGWRGVFRHPFLWLSLQLALLTASASPSEKFCDQLNQGRMLWSLWPFLRPRLTRNAPSVGDSFREQGGRGARLLLKLARRADLVAAVKGCSASVEFVFGEKDPLTSSVDQRIARQLIGDEQVHIAPGAAHWPQVELPHMVAALVVDVVRSATQFRGDVSNT